MKNPYRLYVQPLIEKSDNKPRKGELQVNNITGHLSVWNGSEQVSATKNIETDLNLQKLWLRQIYDSLLKLHDELIKQKKQLEIIYNDLFNIENIIKAVEDLLDYIEKVQNQLENLVHANIQNTYIAYQKIIGYMPTFFKRYLEVLDVLRQIDELKYIYDETKEMMNSVASEYDKMTKEYDTVRDQVSKLAPKYAYIHFLDNEVAQHNAWAKQHENMKTEDINNHNWHVYETIFPDKNSVRQPIGTTPTTIVPPEFNGVSSNLYLWIKFANDANGNGITDNAYQKRYIGLGWNKTSNNPTNNANDYKWYPVNSTNTYPGPFTNSIDKHYIHFFFAGKSLQSSNIDDYFPQRVSDLEKSHPIDSSGIGVIGYYIDGESPRSDNLANYYVHTSLLGDNVNIDFTKKTDVSICIILPVYIHRAFSNSMDGSCNFFTDSFDDTDSNFNERSLYGSKFKSIYLGNANTANYLVGTFADMKYYDTVDPWKSIDTTINYTIFNKTSKFILKSSKYFTYQVYIDNTNGIYPAYCKATVKDGSSNQYIIKGTEVPAGSKGYSIAVSDKAVIGINIVSLNPVNYDNLLDNRIGYCKELFNVSDDPISKTTPYEWIPGYQLIAATQNIGNRDDSSNESEIDSLLTDEEKLLLRNDFRFKYYGTYISSIAYNDYNPNKSSFNYKDYSWAKRDDLMLLLMLVGEWMNTRHRDDHTRYGHDEFINFIKHFSGGSSGGDNISMS